MSDLTNKIMLALEKAQREHAAAALRSPQDPSAFEYGRVSGIYAGLGLAWQIVQESLKDDKDHDDKL